ncbi:MAG: glycosyltransferase family 9 protein, partial [Candidatus Omnitrophica bacterium]|nr:glycosyltransferase family 9 protein [Candidatus Omnitrophota bacterium]
MNNQFKRILIVRTDRLGDVILSTPVIKNLRLAYPKAHIAFICRPYTKDVLLGNPYLDEVIVCDKQIREKGLWGILRFAAALKTKKFDLAIVLHPTDRAHLIVFLAGIPRRVGWIKKMGWLLTDRIPHRKQEGKKHELEYNLDILRYLNIPVEDKKIYFPVSSQAQTGVDERLNQAGIAKNTRFIVIHPSASCPSKRWPENYFSELVKILKAKVDLPMIAVTSKEESGFADRLVKENEIIDFRGKLNIPELGALFKRAALFISNDSGPVHIAASLNVPVISIFGRKDPGLSPLRWMPQGKSSVYLHGDAGCLVCLAHNCQK